MDSKQPLHPLYLKVEETWARVQAEQKKMQQEASAKARGNPKGYTVHPDTQQIVKRSTLLRWQAENQQALQERKHKKQKHKKRNPNARQKRKARNNASRGKK